MSEPKPTDCSACIFHDMQAVVMPDGKPIIGRSQMICRRFPPQVVALQIPTPGGVSMQMMPVFPAVNEDIWCYEFKPEIEASTLN